MSLFKSAFIVLIITNMAAAVQWIFQLTMARVLQPSEFAVISAVTSLGPAIFSIFDIVPQLVSRSIIDKKMSPLNSDQRLYLLRRIIFFAVCIVFLV